MTVRPTYLAILLFPLLALVSSSVLSQNSQRTWSDQSGKHSFEATLVEVTETHAKLKGTDGKEVTVASARLSKTDQGFLEAVRHCEISQSHVVTLESLESQLVDHTDIAVAQIDQLQKKSGGGFAAGLYSSTFKACMGGETQLDQARRQMDETIARIRKVREAFPSMHQKTLLSALNNRAIMAVRDNKPAGAVAMLEDASAIFDETPLVVYHNIKILTQIAGTVGNLNYLGKGERKRLAELVARSHEDTPDTLPNRYIYTLDHDPFHSILDVSKNQASNTNSSSGNLQSLGTIGALWKNRMLPELTCLRCSGNGTLRCPGCSKGVVSEKIRVVVGQNHVGGDVYATKVVATECPQCRGDGGFDCPSCERGRLSL